MVNASTLFEVVGERPAPGAVLVVALDGFMDAGQSGQLAAHALLATDSAREVVRFDADLLVDYRARRPLLTFDADRFSDVVMPDIVIHALTDDDGREFLILTGPEPDVMWERFADAVAMVMHDFSANLVLTMHGIPWGAPHTRPLGITAHASDRSLIAGSPKWIERVQVPAGVNSFLELRLAEKGLKTAGFSVHVPHYLSNGEFHPGAVALLDAVARLASLRWSLPDLRSTADATMREVNQLVSQSTENAAALESMEHAYDAAVNGRALPSPDTPSPMVPENEIPSGDQLAAEFEAFLRDNPK